MATNGKSFLHLGYGWVLRNNVIHAMKDADVPDEQIERVLEVMGRPRLISLQHAAEKYKVPYQTVRRWVSSGRVTRRGTLHNPHGAAFVMVDEDDFIEFFMGSRVKPREIMLQTP